MHSMLGLLVAHVGEDLCLVDLDAPSITPIASGLSQNNSLRIHPHAGEIWWSDGFISGRILSDGTAANWGDLTPPPPKLEVVTFGSMCAGQYMVAVTFVDQFGVEHTPSEPSVVHVAGTDCSPRAGAGFTVSLPWVSPLAVSVNLYITAANGSELYLTTGIEPGQFPITVSSKGRDPWTHYRLDTLSAMPPPPADGIFSYRGFLMVWQDNVVYPSYGINHHLFRTGEYAESFPTTIRGAVGLPEGFWTVTPSGAFWTTGEDPAEWRTIQRDGFEYAGGGFLMEGKEIPELDVETPVAVFASERGVTVGLPNGSLVYLTNDRYHFNVTNKRARFMKRTQRGMRQLMFILV